MPKTTHYPSRIIVNVQVPANLRNQILDSNDLETVAVDCPEWKCKVYVQTMSTKERLAFEKDYNKVAGEYDPVPLVVKRTLDEYGARVFNDDDVKLLENKHPKPVKRIYLAILTVSAVTDKEKEAIEKN